MRSFFTSAKLILAAVAITARCGACTIVYPIVQVGPNFRVRVEDRGRPVMGLRVEIRSSANRTVTDTDKNGFATFDGVSPGHHDLRADRDVGVPDGADLEVKPNGPRNVTVPLKWPNAAPVLVRSLKGTIRGPDYLPGQPQPKLSLDLLEAISGRKLKSLQTTDSGGFDFESLAPGLYFLSLTSGLRGWSGETVGEQVAVAVDLGAPTEHLDLDLGWTSCGMWYADQSQCLQDDLQIEQFSVEVLDAEGAAIADAEVLLFDTANTLIERLQSDSMGKFSSPHWLAGTYQLVVSNPGFTPLRRTLHVEPTGNAARHSGLTVQLGVMGGCSAAKPLSPANPRGELHDHE